MNDTATSNNTFASKKKAFIVGFSVSVIIAILISAILYERYSNHKHNKEIEAHIIANNARLQLQESISNSLGNLNILTFAVKTDGSLRNFDSLASILLSRNKYIESAWLLPDAVINNVYPASKKDSLVGLNLLKDQGLSKSLQRVINTKSLYFNWPVKTGTANLGPLGLLPIYRNDQFWGFCGITIRMSALLNDAGISNTNNGDYYFQLSRFDEQSGRDEFFIGGEKKIDKKFKEELKMPNGKWTMSVIPIKPFKALGDLVILAVLGLAFSILCGIFVYSMARAPEKLKLLVNQRTLQLQESENNYKILFERSPLPLWIYDTDSFNFMEVNDAATRLYGYSREEFLQMNVLMIRPEKDIPGFLEDNKNATEGLRQTGPWTHIKKNGEQIQVLIFATETFYSGKKGRLVLLMDVSEKIKVEEQLIASEEKYRTLVEQAGDGIFIADFQGRFQVVNSAGYEMSQYTEDEIKNMTIYDFIMPEEVAKNPFHFAEMQSGKVARTERKLKRKDGSFMDVEITAKLISHNSFLAIVRDITERKKSEAVLAYQARLLEGVSDAITSLDVNRLIVSWNKACEDLYGFTREEVIGKRVADLIRFEYPGTTGEAVFKQVFETGQWKGEFKFIHPKTGKDVILLSSVNLLKIKTGETTGFVITARDITDWKQAEAAIIKSNERFELIAQATNDVIWDHNFEKNETWGNRKLYEIHGIDSNARINFEMFIEHIHPNDRAGVLARMQEGIEKRHTSISEVIRFRMPDGSYRTFYDRAHLEYNEQGKPLRILGAMQDITEAETIRNQILKEKELSDSIINSLPGIFYLFNKEGRYLRWNKNFEAVTGYTAEEIGTKLRPLDFIDPDEHEMISQRISRVFENSRENVESKLLLKNGDKIPYYFTGQPIVYEGQECLMGVGLDFSDKVKANEAIKASEAKYKELIEQASDGIFISDSTGKYVDVNSSACRMLGYKKEELLQMRAADILNKQEHIDSLADRYNLLRSGSTYILETILKRKDGSLVYVESNAKMLPDGRFISMVRDLTERKKAEEEIRNNSELLRELYSYLQNVREEERTHIAREIHDELGQQLTGLKMDISWLNRRLKTAEKDVLEKLLATLELIDTTIKTVRKIATELRPSILDDLGFLAAMEWQSEEFEKRSGIGVHFTHRLTDVQVPPNISTSLFRIYQELLTNVARHSKATLVETGTYLEGDTIFLSVRDNGHGFDMTGIANKKTLGLTGIKERSSLIGGTYEIKSKPGFGTSVLISVPLHNKAAGVTKQ